MHIDSRKCFSERGSLTPRDIVTVAVVAIMLLGVIFKALMGNVDHASAATYLSGVFKIVFYNVGFWLVLILACAFGLYRKITNPDEFLWRELPIQLGVSFLVILALYSIFFSTTKDLRDLEIWNGYVTKAEYYEAWTERVTHTDSKGKSHTSYVHHPPEWQVRTTAGDFSTSKGVYANYKSHFGNEAKEDLFHLSQSSIGDGDMFYVTCDGNRQKFLPAARPHLYVNYLRASDSIRKLRGNIDVFRASLLPYPKVYDSGLGEIEFDRVLVAEVKGLTKGWTQTLDLRLDGYLETLGHQKEVNILVYLSASPDRAFGEALKEHWVQGKKNDVIVVIGAPEFPKVRWAEVIAWTKVEEFKIGLRDKVTAMGSIENASKLAEVIVSEVAKPAKLGGYERTPMADLEYLIADIKLPIWCQFVIVLIGGAASWLTSFLLIRNEWRVWRPRSWRSQDSRRYV